MRTIGIFLSVAAMAFVAFAQDANAQFTAPTSPQTSLTQLSPQKPSIPTTTPEGMTFESSVDPTEYHLGPGDVFECSFWTSGQAFYPVVSSDNVLLVPNLGAFDVHGKTLAQIRQEVLQAAAESFASRKQDSNHPPVSLTLYAPRKIYVKVRGDVAAPGDFALSAATRPDVAVDLANKIDPSMLPAQLPVSQSQLEINRESKERFRAAFGTRKSVPASERNITVAHDDGTTERVDLVRYNSTHDPKASPPLRQGDVIYVPFRDMNGPSIGVYGAVQSPGEFEFVSGDSLSTVIQYAFGPSANADIHHVEITRMRTDGAVSSPSIYDLASIKTHQAADVALEPNDRIVVRSIHEEHHGAVVLVQGEVLYPGVYPISDGQTKLSAVIHKAGGLDPAAYPSGGIILRHGSAGRQSAGTEEEIAYSTRLEHLTVSDTTNFQKQTSMRRPSVIVDMDRLFIQGDSSADVTLDDGDEIVIPKRPTSVYIYGFVNNAGYVSYRDNAPLSYYIAQAGGYAAGAIKSETAVIKLKSKAWLYPDDTKIEPGDEIFVPKEPDLPENYNTQNIQTIASLAVSVTSLLVSLYLTFIKKP